jgi:hypothetical protein
MSRVSKGSGYARLDTRITTFLQIYNLLASNHFVCFYKHLENGEFMLKLQVNNHTSKTHYKIINLIYIKRYNIPDSPARPV